MQLLRLAPALLMLASVAAFADETPPVPVQAADGETVVQQRGEASFYSDKFAGLKTATGDKFRQDKLTAASKELPLGTRVRVTNEANGKSVVVKVNDRGPFIEGRVVDLSRTAAVKIGITKKQGVAPVTVEARPSSQPTPELKQQVRRLAANGVVEPSAIAQE